MSGIDITAGLMGSIARQCFGEPNPRLSTAHELRFRRRGSLVVNLSRAVFADHEAGVSGGVLAMIVHAGAARTTAEAARLLEGQGVIETRQSVAERQEHARRKEAAARQRRASAAALWSQASPLGGSLAERYLRQARAIEAPLGAADLRSLPARGRHPPAMVARVCDAAGCSLGLHITRLQADGLGKAHVDQPRKCIGPVGGGFIFLAAGSPLVVAEGIETALSAWEALDGPAKGAGCIASISAGGMVALKWPTDAPALIIAPDRDANRAGENAAEALANRARKAGLAVSFLRPPPGYGDWNHWAQTERSTR